MQQLEHLDGADRRLLGRLEHDGAAGGERGPDLPGDHRDRVVPRRDRRDHADRLVQHDEALVGARRRDRLAVDALGLLGEPQQEVGGVLHLVAGHAERLALLARHRRRQLLLALHHELPGPVKPGRAVIRRQPGPGREGAVRRLDGTARIFARPVRHVRDLLAGRRVAHLEGRAAARVQPFALDIHRRPHCLSAALSRFPGSPATRCRNQHSHSPLTAAIPFPDPEPFRRPCLPAHEARHLRADASAPRGATATRRSGAGCCRPWSRRGHRVVFFEHDVPYYAVNRDLHGAARRRARPLRRLGRGSAAPRPGASCATPTSRSSRPTARTASPRRELVLRRARGRCGCSTTSTRR